MKKLAGFFLAAVLMTACNKDSPDVPDPDNAPDISPVPANFIQKILIEQFTSTGCGQCPQAHLYIDSLQMLFPDRIYNASIHVNDLLMDTSLSDTTSSVHYLDSLFNTSSLYPSGMVNRDVSTVADMSPVNWFQQVASKMSHVPNCGIAADAKTITHQNILNLEVHVGFSDQMFGDYRIHAYMVQPVFQTSDSLYDQMNDFSIEGTTPDSLSPLYLLNDTIRNYRHKHVLRRVITPAEGDPIPQSLMFTGNEYIKNYPVNMSGVDPASCYVLIFVDKHGTTGTSHRIENVQRLTIGEAVDWN